VCVGGASFWDSATQQQEQQ